MCRELISPDLQTPPSDVEELLDESNFLNRQLYPCEACDNPVSTLIGLGHWDDGETFATQPDEASNSGAAPMTQGAVG